MSIGTALSIASSGLANINLQMGLLSQNVANAGVPNYAVEVAAQQSATTGTQGMGVVSAPPTLQVDKALQAALFSQSATVTGLTTRQTALQALDAAQGTPGQGTDLPSLLGDLQTQFSALLNQPDNQTQQSKVVQSATTLAQGINALTNAYTRQRQVTQDDLAGAVGTLNTDLANVGALSARIVALKAGGQSTADLENQRNAAVASLSQLLDVKTLEQSNGDLLVTTPGGMVLPTRGAQNPFAIQGANVEPGQSHASGTLPGVTLNGVDVTSQLQGGRIGADITLRDQTLPAYQAGLDEFAQGLASRFQAQGLTLLSDPTGAVPAAGATAPVQAGYVGFSATIQVNPAVAAQPSLVRDGTNPTATFTPNPAGGLAGFTTLVGNVLAYTFGSTSDGSTPQPALNTSGLGVDGTLSVPFVAPPTLAGYIADLMTAQSQDSAATTSQLGTEQGVQTSLNDKFTATSGVNMDTEMSAMVTLQSAYSANARVISAVQTMLSQLMNVVQ
jgi:flagellar hook-associated protein 1 FlgK